MYFLERRQIFHGLLTNSQAVFYVSLSLTWAGVLHPSLKDLLRRECGNITLKIKRLTHV